MNSFFDSLVKWWGFGTGSNFYIERVLSCSILACFLSLKYSAMLYAMRSFSLFPKMTGKFLILSLQASSSFMLILSAFLGTKFERYEEFIILAEDAAFKH